MKIYWSLKSIPELADLSLDERKKRWRSIYKSTFVHWETWIGIALFMMCGVMGIYFSNMEETAVFWVLWMLGGFLYGQILIYVARRYYRRSLLGESD